MTTRTSLDIKGRDVEAVLATASSTCHGTNVDNLKCYEKGVHRYLSLLKITKLSKDFCTQQH